MLSHGRTAGWLDGWFPGVRDKMGIATPAAGGRREGGDRKGREDGSLENGTSLREKIWEVRQ